MRREYLTGRCLHEAVFSVTVKEQEIPLRKRLADLMSPPHPPGIRRTLALQMSLSDEAEGSSINNKAHRRGDCKTGAQRLIIVTESLRKTE